MPASPPRSPKRAPKKEGNMQQLQDVSQQLSRYVADVESLEGENDELRVQLEELKSQLGKERALVKDTFLQAKQSWKAQALNYAEKEREREKKRLERASRPPPPAAGIGNGNGETLSAAGKGERAGGPGAALAVVAQLRAQAQASQPALRAYLALLTSSAAPLLFDFDAQQGHVGLANPTHAALRLRDYAIALSWPGGEGGAWMHLRYHFSTAAELSPHSCLSLWWGRQNRHLHCPEAGSYVWDAAVPCPLPLPPPAPAPPSSPAPGVSSGGGLGLEPMGNAQLFHGSRLLAHVANSGGSGIRGGCGGGGGKGGDDAGTAAAAGHLGREDHVGSAAGGEEWVWSSSGTAYKGERGRSRKREREAEHGQGPDRPAKLPRVAPSSAAAGDGDGDREAAEAAPVPWLLTRRGGAVSVLRVAYSLSVTTAAGAPNSNVDERSTSAVLLLMQNTASLPCCMHSWSLHLQFVASTHVLPLPDMTLPAAGGGEICLFSGGEEEWEEEGGLADRVGCLLTHRCMPVPALSATVLNRLPCFSSLVTLTVLNANDTAVCMWDGTQSEGLAGEIGEEEEEEEQRGPKRSSLLSECTVM